MSRPSLVTVIIIFFEAEQFIEETIESVFAQTYDQWELLLVDDGSTDGSTAIAQGYAEKYPEKVCYLEHEGHQNRGMSAARNLGIYHASGECIFFLDADDVVLPNTLEAQAAILESNPDAALVFGPIQWWYSWTGKPEDIGRDFVENLGVPPNTLIRPPSLLALFLRDKATVPSGFLVRREVVDHVGGFEEAFRGEYEDQVFCAKVCLKEAVFAAGECWYHYRQHPNSCVSLGHKTGQTHAARLYFLNWLEGYLSDQQVKNREVWQALHRELWRYRHPNVYQLWQSVQHLEEQMREILLLIAQRTLPLPIRHWLWAKWIGADYCPPTGWVRFGSLRRLTPLSREFGYDRGLPVDRHYIEGFLLEHSADIRGRVLEIADDTYTRQFGGDRVTKSDVLHVEPGHPKATIVGDLTCAELIPSGMFDCVILTQTLQLIYDLPAAIRTLYRILRPGGIILATVPGISPVSRYDMERWGYFWAFTTLSARRVFEEVFPTESVIVEAYGNVLTASAFLYGLAAQELRRQELDYLDPDYELVITIRAVKPEITNEVRL